MKNIQPYIFGIEGLTLSEREKEAFHEAPPFGIILFLRNIDNPKQLASLIESVKSTTNSQSLIFIDQEGGRVQRLAPPFWTQFPIAGDLDQLDDEKFEKAVYALYRLISDELAQAGIEVNCAPCLDLRTSYTATFLQDRCFGANEMRVISAGHASCRAMKDAGIIPVLKHLPGHGRARVDSHLELPKVQFEEHADLTNSREIPADIRIFQEDYGVDLAMSAHILYPQIDQSYPLTLSSKGIDFVREIVGFQGVLMSDDLAMKALSGTQGELAKQAMDAGIDLVMSCGGKIEEIEEVYQTGLQASEKTINTHAKLVKSLKARPASLSKTERSKLLRSLEGL